MLTTMQMIWLILLASFQVSQSTPPDQSLPPSPGKLPSDQPDQLLPNHPDQTLPPSENLPQHRPCHLQNPRLNRPQHPPLTNSTSPSDNHHIEFVVKTKTTGKKLFK